MKQINLKTGDGESIHCLYLLEPNSKDLLIYFHGNGENIDQKLAELDLLRNMGVNVLGVEYRGYSGCSGKPSEKGIYLDGDAALKYACDSLGFSLGRIIICGRSIGTAVAVNVSQSKPLAGVILITPMTTGKNLAKAYGLWILEPFIGDPFDNLGKAARITSPVLIIHGTGDGVIPYRMGRKLYETLKCPKKFVTIEGGHHNDLEFVDSTAYWNSIEAFIRMRMENR
jgi:hypothetical protein